MLHQIFDFFTVLGGQTVACGVGDVADRCSGVHHSLDDTRQVFVVRATGILGVELHVLHVLLGILYGSHGTLDDFLAVGVELEFNVRIARADTRVDTLALGILKRLGSHVDVLLHGTCQRTDGGPCHGLGDFNHGIEVART